MKKKCLIIYPYFALYRKHVFDALFASNFGWEFELVGDKECDFGIKGIDPKLAEVPLKEGGYNWTFAKNYLPFGKKLPLHWQPAVLKRLLKKDYDAVIMLGSIYYLAYILALPILKFYKIPLIFWTHGFLGKDNKIIEFLRHALYKKGDGFLLYGERAQKIMLESGYYSNKRLDVIYNSLDYELLKDIHLSEEEISNIKNEIFRYPDNPLVIATGRVTKEKRFNYLIQALDISIKKNKKFFNLLIIGDGPELDCLNALTSERGLNDYVNFSGAIYGKDTYKFLMTSDLCVIPGNVGLSAMHAFSVGLPVISHDNFDIQMPEFEAIIDSKTGSFYKYGNVEDLLEKIYFWAFNKQRLEAAKNDCFLVTSERYNVKFQLQVFKECLSQFNHVNKA
jgi:glycosyltransferase involved in cell wall biosynthesis